MFYGLLWRLADDGNIQVPADHCSDVSERYALLAYTVIARSRGALRKNEPIQRGGIEAVDCRPAIEPVTYIR